MIDNLTANDVSPSSPLFYVQDLWCLILVWSFLILGSFMIFQLCLDPWAGCEEYVEYERALDLNGC